MQKELAATLAIIELTEFIKQSERGIIH